MSTVVVSNDAKYDEVYKAYAASKDTVELANGFSGVGSSGDGQGFNKGEIITLPDVIKVLGRKMPGSTNLAEFVIVKVTTPKSDGTPGAVRYQPFYLKSLAKRTNKLTLNENKEVIDSKFEKARGAAAQWYQEQNGRQVNDIAKDLVALGKDIVVTDVEPVKTYQYRSTEIIDSNIYTYDFV